MVFFCLSRLDAYFLTIIAGIDNTERMASDFSNVNVHIFSNFIQVLQGFKIRGRDGWTDRLINDLKAPQRVFNLIQNIEAAGNRQKL